LKLTGLVMKLYITNSTTKYKLKSHIKQYAQFASVESFDSIHECTSQPACITNIY